MPCERKHIEAIEEARGIVSSCRNGRIAWPLRLRVTNLLDKALAACDESPCVWDRLGEDGPWHPSCLGYHPHVSWSCWSRAQMERCPHCGRKIAPLPAAPEVGK